jgi:hypothetical protein
MPHRSSIGAALLNTIATAAAGYLTRPAGPPDAAES